MFASHVLLSLPNLELKMLLREKCISTKYFRLDSKQAEMASGSNIKPPERNIKWALLLFRRKGTALKGLGYFFYMKEPFNVT
jgi:hypothetical protein